MAANVVGKNHAGTQKAKHMCETTSLGSQPLSAINVRISDGVKKQDPKSGGW